MLIELNQVIPEPIPKEMIERSEVWGTQLKIEPQSISLISAHSGKGKSTLLHLLPGPKPPLTIRVESIPLLLLIPMTNPTSFTEMGALMEATLPTQKRPAARGQ